MNPAHRKKARAYALQALYQWHMAGSDLADIEDEFLTDCSFKKADFEYFHQLLYGVAENVSSLDAHFEPLLDRPLKDLGPVELSILRLSTYELTDCLDVPYKVVIDQGIELAKNFGATDAHKYINGVLDKLAPRLRPHKK